MHPDKMGFNQEVNVDIERKREKAAELFMSGQFIIEHFNKKGEKIGEYTVKNGVTNVGLNTVLDVMFHNTSQHPTWYIGLVDNSGWTAWAAGDTMSSHAGWSEATQYSESARQPWTEGAAASQSITNSTTVDFSINATKTLKGIFITSDNTKSGTTGILWATGSFSSTVSVSNGDTLKITYTVSAAAA